MNPMMKQETNYGALSTLTTVFFFWGFIAAGNSVFIPFCKSYFNLDQFQSQLIDFAFYGAYYVGALFLFVFGTSKGKDFVGEWGYKRSIVIGLLISALGAMAMIFSVYFNHFVGMLIGLFIVALGFSLQQTAANPFMIILGDEKTGSSRINLGGAVNSLGTTIGPLIISLALFGTTASISDEMIASLSLSKVILLYAFVGLLFVGIAMLFGFSKKVPEGKIVTETTNQEPPQKAVSSLLIMTGILVFCFAPVFYSYKENLAWNEEKKEMFRMWGWLSGLAGVIVVILVSYLKAKKEEGWGAMKYPQLTLGMLAIFVYVGVEVAIGSNLGELLKEEAFGGYEKSEIAPFISMFWGSLMIGRWTGAVSALNLSEKAKNILRFIVPLLAFAIVLSFSKITGYQIKDLYWYILCVLVQIFAYHISKEKPSRTLIIFGFLGMLSMVVGLVTSGMIGIYAFLSGGLFCSIMWPSIFSLSLAGLGKYQTQGSALLIMMILGGAIIPPLQGKLADVIGIHQSFIVPVICFLYIAFFGFFAKDVLKKQGISF